MPNTQSFQTIHLHEGLSILIISFSKLTKKKSQNISKSGIHAIVNQGEGV